MHYAESTSADKERQAIMQTKILKSFQLCWKRKKNTPDIFPMKFKYF